MNREKKYPIEIISVKTYKKVPLFFVAKTLKDITSHSLKQAKYIHNSLSHLKPMLHFILMLPSNMEQTRLVTNLPPP